MPTPPAESSDPPQADLGRFSDHYNTGKLEGGMLDGKDWVLTIKSVEKGVEVAAPTGEKALVDILHFEETDKHLILNITRGRIIRDKLGYTDRYEQWIGRKITVYPARYRTPDDPDFLGIKIRPTIPE